MTERVYLVHRVQRYSDTHSQNDVVMKVCGDLDAAFDYIENQAKKTVATFRSNAVHRIDGQLETATTGRAHVREKISFEYVITVEEVVRSEPKPAPGGSFEIRPIVIEADEFLFGLNASSNEVDDEKPYD